MNIIFFTGKDYSLGSENVGLTHAVVVKLVDLIKDRGHHVYMDNFYTSPQVFADLRDNGFGACGTLRLNCRGLPPAIHQKVRKGEKATIRLIHRHQVDGQTSSNCSYNHPQRQCYHCRGVPGMQLVVWRKWRSPWP